MYCIIASSAWSCHIVDKLWLILHVKYAGTHYYNRSKLNYTMSICYVDATF